MDKIDAGLISGRSFTPSYRHWTIGAICCYDIGCNCSRCDLRFFLKNCQMKRAVFHLVKNLKAPYQRDIKDLVIEIAEGKSQCAQENMT